MMSSDATRVPLLTTSERLLCIVIIANKDPNDYPMNY
jgi:hypothetical protein